MSELKLDLEKESLQLRMAEFKSDSEKMQDVNDFLNDLFEKAQKEAQIRNGKSKGKLMEVKELEPGQIELVLKLAHLQIGFLRQFVIAQTQKDLVSADDEGSKIE